MPNQVHRIFRAQQLHDKKHYDERVSATPEARAKLPYIDYLRPIIADADMGLVLYRPHMNFTLFNFPRHGGLSTVMKLAKLFAESVSAFRELTLCL